MRLRPVTFRYKKPEPDSSAMLLNEVQKQRQIIETLERRPAELEARMPQKSGDAAQG